GVVGIYAGLDLRIPALAPALPGAPIDRFFPLLWAGFWVNAITGTILLAAEATTKMTNPDFYVKMIFIGLAIINLQMLRKRVFRDPLIDKAPFSMNAKILTV